MKKTSPKQSKNPEKKSVNMLTTINASRINVL